MKRSGRPALSLCMIAALAACANAQDLSLSGIDGYVLTLPVYQGRSGGASWSGSGTESGGVLLTRARLRGETDVTRTIRLQIEYELAAIASTLPFPPGSENRRIPRQWIRLDQSLLTRPSLVVRHGIDRLYGKYEGDVIAFIIGRQLISWGTGRVWRPTDLFNPLNPADYGKIERDGADAAAARWYAGDFTDLQVVYNPDRTTRFDNWGARFRTNASGVDFSFMTGSIGDMWRVGMDFAGNLFTAGIRGEALWSRPRTPDSVRTTAVAWMLGVDHQLTPALYALLEYYHDGAGASSSGLYRYDRLAAGEIINLGSDYLVVMSTYLVNPLLQVSATANLNVRDGSAYVMPGVSYSLAQNLQGGLSAMITLGPSGSEFALYPVAAFARIQYFF